MRSEMRRRPCLQKGCTIAAVVLAFTALGAAFSSGISSADTLRVPIPDGWVMGNVIDNQKTGYLLMQFVPAGQTVENPTETIVVEDSLRWAGAPATPYLKMHQWKTRVQAECGERTFWNALQQGPNWILYEWKTLSLQCRLKQPDQHAITTILYGLRNIWTVTYSGRVKDFLPPEVRDWWIAWLSGIEIVPQ